MYNLSKQFKEIWEEELNKNKETEKLFLEMGKVLIKAAQSDDKETLKLFWNMFSIQKK